jgi:hypothetical protein
MSESANAVLMRKAWHTRNELYRELFGAEPTFILPKQYEPPAEPQPSFGASDETTPLGERAHQCARLRAV